MKIWHLAVAGVVLLAVGVIWLLRAVEAQRARGSDEEQIRHAIVAAAKAAERRDDATITRMISDDYKDSNGFRVDVARGQVRRVLREAREVTAYIPADSLSVTVDPDRRNASASFQVRFHATGARGEIKFDTPMQVRFVHEPVRYYLVFPGEEWRLASAEGYGAGFDW